MSGKICNFKDRFYLTGALMAYIPLHKGGVTVSEFTECPICDLDEKKILEKC